jgi:hypothetical protein
MAPALYLTALTAFQMVIAVKQWSKRAVKAVKYDSPVDGAVGEDGGEVLGPADAAGEAEDGDDGEGEAAEGRGRLLAYVLYYIILYYIILWRARSGRRTRTPG